GSASDELIDCEQPSGYVADATDCDDTSAVAYPGGIEVCDGLDNDCNGTIDDDNATDASAWYYDGDGDGYGDNFDVLYSCDEPAGYAPESGDCDDEKFNISPASLEYCNDYDDNCNGTIDEDAVDKDEWYPDLDGDGYGDSAAMITACSQPASFVGNGSDCDDTDNTEWTLVEGLSYTCGLDEDTTTETDDDSKGCSSVSGLGGGVFALIGMIGLVGRRRR
ncbi:MAG: hypothetical protein ACI8RZ_002731, partial [Myxococcota bacterium]